MKCIFVWPRVEAERFVRENAHRTCKPYGMISITSPAQKPASFPAFDQGRHRLLRTEFHEVEAAPCIAGYPPMGACEADRILAFVGALDADGFANLLVHCEAGVARSYSVALALNEIFGIALPQGLRGIRVEHIVNTLHRRHDVRTRCNGPNIGRPIFGPYGRNHRFYRCG